MNFAAFDLNLLRVFDALMRERSATRAGERIGLSQPAVSAALARLRHALGDGLFVRQRSEMIPTPRALALAGPIREALARVEGALQGAERFAPATAERAFTLLGADFFALMLMPALAEELAKAAPGIALRFVDSAHGEVEPVLTRGAADFALEPPHEVPDWIARRLLFKSPFAVIAAKDHRALRAARVKRGAPVPLDLFCALPHALRSIDGSTTGAIDAALATVGRKRRVVLALPQFISVAHAVARGQLIASVPVQFATAFAAPLGLATYAVPVPVAVPPIYLYWHRRHDDDAAHAWMRDRIAAHCAAW